MNAALSALGPFSTIFALQLLSSLAIDLGKISAK